MKSNIISFGSLCAAAALLAASAYAGGPVHRLPADDGKTYPAYEIRIASMPSNGHPLMIQVVDKETGRLVTGAHVSMQHAVWQGIKAVPQYQQSLVALEPDGQGDYVCTREHVGHGERIVVRAHITGEPSGAWATLVLS